MTLKTALQITALIAIMTIGTTGYSYAADTWEQLSVQAALNSPLGKEKLDPDITFLMKGQKHKKVTNLSREYTANKRARKFRRTVEDACQNAFISALLSFQQRVQREGHNAVVDLYSITKDQKFESSTEYSCLVGGMSANVALRGKVGDINK